MGNRLFDALIRPLEDDPALFLQVPGHGNISRDAFFKMAAGFSHALVNCGVRPGDRVAVQVEKSIEALALYAGTLGTGAIFLPLNTAYTPSEITYFVENAEPSILVCSESKSKPLQSICRIRGVNLMTLNADGSGTLPAAADRQKGEFADREPDDLAAILYTSGTTGRSKGAMLTHENLLSNADTLVDYWRFTEDDILLHALPIYHTHGLFVATNVMLLARGSMIFLPRFDLDEVIAALPQASAMMGVPTFYTRLLADKRLNRDLVGHVRLFISGSAPLLSETHAEFAKRTGHQILERYGMTETNMNTSNPYDGERRAGTVGFPLPGIDLRITDAESGKVLPQGEIGMIEVKGPNVFKGYWRMTEKTREDFRADGFFITGDLGRIDEDGYVQIVGRSKDLIISGGFNIYPKEIELVLDAVDGVEESAVIGIAHPDLGEAVVAAVVMKNGADPSEERLLQSAGAQLARFKQPRRIFVVPELPRNAMGKVQKNLLREKWGDLFKPSREPSPDRA